MISENAIADKTGSGEVGLELFYNFNTESLHIPATVLSARADLPCGRNSNGVDTTVNLEAWKMTFINTSWLHRLPASLSSGGKRAIT